MDKEGLVENEKGEGNHGTETILVAADVTLRERAARTPKSEKKIGW